MLKKYKRVFMKRIIFLSLIMFSAMFLDAQEIAKKDLHVNIKALMFGQLYSFNVDIYKSENNVKVVYSVLDNLSAKQMLDIFLANNGTDGNGTKFFINIDSIATLKNLYQKDSIEFKTKSNLIYSALIDSCFLPNAHQFDNQLPPDVVHIGGVPYKFVFKEDQKKIKEFMAISPADYNYPFLSYFIKETFHLYIKLGHQPILNKTNTNGKFQL